MANTIRNNGKRLAKVAIAKASNTSADFGTVTNKIISQVSALSQALGITYDFNNDVDQNLNNERLLALESAISTVLTSIADIETSIIDLETRVTNLE